MTDFYHDYPISVLQALLNLSFLMIAHLLMAFVTTFRRGYYRSLLYRISRYVNQRLVRWAMRKVKHLRGRKKKTVATLERLVKVRPTLFAH